MAEVSKMEATGNGNRPSLSELKTWFSERMQDVPWMTPLPSSVRMDAGVITDVRQFIQSHLSVLEANSGKKLFLPYYLRLVKLRELLG
jgi:hypothetical protein